MKKLLLLYFLLSNALISDTWTSAPKKKNAKKSNQKKSNQKKSGRGKSQGKGGRGSSMGSTITAGAVAGTIAAAASKPKTEKELEEMQANSKKVLTEFQAEVSDAEKIISGVSLLIERLENTIAMLEKKTNTTIKRNQDTMNLIKNSITEDKEKKHYQDCENTINNYGDNMNGVIKELKELTKKLKTMHAEKILKTIQNNDTNTIARIKTEILEIIIKMNNILQWAPEAKAKAIKAREDISKDMISNKKPIGKTKTLKQIKFNMAQASIEAFEEIELQLRHIISKDADGNITNDVTNLARRLKKASNKTQDDVNNKTAKKDKKEKKMAINKELKKNNNEERIKELTRENESQTNDELKIKLAQNVLGQLIAELLTFTLIKKRVEQKRATFQDQGGKKHPTYKYTFSSKSPKAGRSANKDALELYYDIIRLWLQAIELHPSLSSIVKRTEAKLNALETVLKEAKPDTPVKKTLSNIHNIMKTYMEAQADSKYTQDKTAIDNKFKKDFNEALNGIRAYSLYNNKLENAQWDMAFGKDLFKAIIKSTLKTYENNNALANEIKELTNASTYIGE